MLTTKILVTRDMNEEELKIAMYAAVKQNTMKFLVDNEFLKNSKIDWVACNKRLVDKIIIQLEKRNLDLRDYIDACNIFTDLMVSGQVYDAMKYNDMFFAQKYGFVRDITLEHLQNFVYVSLREEMNKEEK